MMQSAVSSVSYRNLLSDPRFISIMALSVVGTMGTNILSPALPGIAAGLGISDARVGLVMTTFQLSGIVMIPITGLLTDLYGRRYVVLPSLFLFAAAGTAAIAIDTFGQLLVICTLLGAAFAGIMPLSITLIGDLYSGATGSAAQGMRTSANGIGAIVFPTVTGILVGLRWNYPFLIFGGSFLVLGLAYLYIPETIGSSGEGDADRTVRRYGRAIRGEVAQTDLATLIVGGFTRDFARYGLLTFAPLFAVSVLDASFAQAGAIISVRGFAYIVVSPIVGIVVARFSRKITLLGALVISIGSLMAVPLSQSIIWLGLLIGIYTIGDALFSPVLKDTITDTAADGNRGGVVGILNIAKNSGKAAAPAVFGVVLSVLGYDAVFWGATVVLVVYGAAVLHALDPEI